MSKFIKDRPSFVLNIVFFLCLAGSILCALAGGYAGHSASSRQAMLTSVPAPAPCLHSPSSS